MHTPHVMVALLCWATTLHAQSIADRVARVVSGSVRLSFAARPGICGRGTSIVHGSRGTTTWGSSVQRDVEWDTACEPGPVRVVLDLRDHELSALRTYVGGRWRPSGDAVTDLGTVPAAAAAEYLLALVAGASSRVSRDAILPAALADSAVVWPTLLRVARDDGRPRETRRGAVFWLGQMAGDAATASLADLVGDAALDREVRAQAIFALSQLPHGDGVPALIRVARTSRDPELRRRALFWLGESRDPRALDLFEELLRK